MQSSGLLLLVALLVVGPCIGCGEKPASTVIKQPALSPEEQAAADAAYEESMK